MATCETSDSGLERTPSDRTFVLLAAAITGVVASNLFAPQILVGPIGSSLGMTEQQAGIISSITFLGYASGLFLLVPLTDILENKRLILFTLISNIIAAFTTAARRGRHARAGASSSGWQDFGPGIASPAAAQCDTSRAEVRAARGKASRGDPCGLMCWQKLCCHGPATCCYQAISLILTTHKVCPSGGEHPIALMEVQPCLIDFLGVSQR